MKCIIYLVMFFEEKRALYLILNMFLKLLWPWLRLWLSVYEKASSNTCDATWDQVNPKHLKTSMENISDQHNLSLFQVSASYLPRCWLDADAPCLPCCRQAPVAVHSASAEHASRSWKSVCPWSRRRAGNRPPSWDSPSRATPRHSVNIGECQGKLF